MRGLLNKTFREAWPTMLLVGLVLFALEVLLTLVLPQIYKTMGPLLPNIPIAKTFLSGLLGEQFGEQISARPMQGFLWMHPVVLTLVWAYEITFCTRMPAGEIDRGTIDVLLGLPVSRRAVYCCESIVWLATGLIILALGLAGHRLVAPTMPDELRPELRRALFASTNLFGVYIAVGGIAFLASAMSDRRGRAVGAAFAIVLAFFLLNFIANLWPPAKQVAFLGILHYYQPSRIMQTGELPLRDLTVLLAVGGVAWLIGGLVFARRNISTV